MIKCYADFELLQWVHITAFTKFMSLVN